MERKLRNNDMLLKDNYFLNSLTLEQISFLFPFDLLLKLRENKLLCKKEGKDKYLFSSKRIFYLMYFYLQKTQEDFWNPKNIDYTILDSCLVYEDLIEFENKEELYYVYNLGLFFYDYYETLFNNMSLDISLVEKYLEINYLEGKLRQLNIIDTLEHPKTVLVSSVKKVQSIYDSSGKKIYPFGLYKECNINWLDHVTINIVDIPLYVKEKSSKYKSMELKYHEERRELYKARFFDSVGLIAKLLGVSNEYLNIIKQDYLSTEIVVNKCNTKITKANLKIALNKVNERLCRTSTYFTVEFLEGNLVNSLEKKDNVELIVENKAKLKNNKYNVNKKDSEVRVEINKKEEISTIMNKCSIEDIELNIFDYLDNMLSSFNKNKLNFTSGIVSGFDLTTLLNINGIVLKFVIVNLDKKTTISGEYSLDIVENYLNELLQKKQYVNLINEKEFKVMTGISKELYALLYIKGIIVPYKKEIEKDSLRLFYTKSFVDSIKLYINTDECNLNYNVFNYKNLDNLANTFNVDTNSLCEVLMKKLNYTPVFSEILSDGTVEHWFDIKTMDINLIFNFI